MLTPRLHLSILFSHFLIVHFPRIHGARILHISHVLHSAFPALHRIEFCTHTAHHTGITRSTRIHVVKQHSHSIHHTTCRSMNQFSALCMLSQSRRFQSQVNNSRHYVFLQISRTFVFFGLLHLKYLQRIVASACKVLTMHTREDEGL